LKGERKTFLEKSGEGRRRKKNVDLPKTHQRGRGKKMGENSQKGSITSEEKNTVQRKNLKGGRRTKGRGRAKQQGDLLKRLRS